MAREPVMTYSMGKDFAADIRWQVLDINKDARAKNNLDKPFCLWLTGLSGAGNRPLRTCSKRKVVCFRRTDLHSLWRQHTPGA